MKLMVVVSSEAQQLHIVQSPVASDSKLCVTTIRTVVVVKNTNNPPRLATGMRQRNQPIVL